MLFLENDPITRNEGCVRAAFLFLSLFVGVSALAEVDVLASDASLTTIGQSKIEFFVSDPHRSIVFYQLLGFEVVHSKTYGYTTLQNGPVVIALSPLPGWLPIHWLGFLRLPPFGTELVFYTRHLEDAFSQFEDAGYSPGEIELQSWGDRDFRVTDPDGYYIRISEGSAIPVSE